MDNTEKVTIWIIPSLRKILITDSLLVPPGISSAIDIHPMSRKEAMRQGLIDGSDSVQRTRCVALPWARVMADEVGYEVEVELFVPLDAH